MPTLPSHTHILPELAKLTALNQGWQYLPCDHPEEAAFGYMAFRYVRPDGLGVMSPIILPVKDGLPEDAKEEMITYDWLPFGKRMVPEETICKDAETFQTMLKTLRESRMTFPCDDPSRRRVGYVAYNATHFTAQVLRIPVVEFKNCSSAIQMEWQINQAMRHK